MLRKNFRDMLNVYLVFFNGNFYLWVVLLTDSQSFWEGVYDLLHAGHFSGLILSGQLDSGCSNNGI